ncbi:hypothetical protein BTZ20_0259 [Rhodococcus sp. MTM3W5.2]|nr:hypothetical protein BTZ20_0259 [Rhodococcus sp. MTM3W5.2]
MLRSGTVPHHDLLARTDRRRGMKVEFSMAITGAPESGATAVVSG